MARMIRKQIVIDAEREEILARLASERGMSQSELIRHAIDEMVAAQEAREADEARRREAHQRLMEFFDEGVLIGEPFFDEKTGKRKWKREDLYVRGSTRR